MSDRTAFDGAISTTWTRTPLNQIGPDDTAELVLRTIPTDCTSSTSVYVSKDKGDDGNSGLTELLPKATISAAITVIEASTTRIYIVVLDSEQYNEILSFATLNYTSYAASVECTWRDVTWSNKLESFFAVGDTGVSTIMKSPDGRAWETITGTAYNYKGVTVSDSGIIVAVGEPDGVSPEVDEQIVTSYDGVTFTARTAPSVDALQGVCHSTSLGLFVAVGDSVGGTYNVMTSPDGITWTGRTSPATSYWKDVIWVDELELFIAVGNGTKNIMTSPDGITWTGQTSPECDYTSVTYSPDLELLVAVADVGTTVALVATSPDGVIWTTRDASEDTAWESVTWVKGYGVFVAVASAGTNQIMTSPDGTTWTGLAEPEANAWTGVCFAPEIMTLVGVSSDGTNRVMQYGRNIAFIAAEGESPTLNQSPYYLYNFGQIDTTTDRAVNDILIWDSKIYVATDNGVYYSTDEAVTWTGPLTGTAAKNILQLSYTTEGLTDRLFLLNETDETIDSYSKSTELVSTIRSLADTPTCFGTANGYHLTYGYSMYFVVGYGTDALARVFSTTSFAPSVGTDLGIYLDYISTINPASPTIEQDLKGHLTAVGSNAKIYNIRVTGRWSHSISIVDSTSTIHYSIYKYVDSAGNHIIYDSNEIGVFRYNENTIDYNSDRAKIINKIPGYEFNNIIHYLNEITLLIGTNGDGDVVYYDTTTLSNSVVLSTGDITPSCFLYNDENILMGNSTPDGATHYEIIELRNRLEIQGNLHMEGFYINYFTPLDEDNGGTLNFKYCYIYNLNTTNRWKYILNNNIINRDQYISTYPLKTDQIDAQYNLMINTPILLEYAPGNDSSVLNNIIMNNAYESGLAIISKDDDDIVKPTAAAYCDAITLGDRSDWYLPTRNEIEELVTQAVLGNMPVDAEIEIEQPKYVTSNANFIYVQYYANIDGTLQFGSGTHTEIYAVRPIRTFTAAVGAYAVGDFGEAGWVFYEDAGEFLEVSPSSAEIDLAFANDTVEVGTGEMFDYFEGAATTALIVASQYNMTIFNNIFSNNYIDILSYNSTSYVYNTMYTSYTGNAVFTNCSNTDPLLVDYQPADLARGFIKQSEAIRLSAGCYLFLRTLVYENLVDFKVNYNPTDINVSYNPSNLISYTSDTGEYYDSMDGYRRTWKLSWGANTANEDWKLQRNKILSLNTYSNSVYRWGDQDASGDWVPLYDGTAITFADNVGTIDAADDVLPFTELQNHYINVASGYYHIDTNTTTTITLDQYIPDGVYGIWTVDFIGVKVKKNSLSMSSPGHADIDSHPYAGYSIDIIESEYIIDSEINWAENMT